jgi:branched-chain amino acid transport system substrate-binding protein
MEMQMLFNRRTFVKGTSTLVAAPVLLQSRQATAATPFKIGMVSALTGPLAGFGETHNFILEGLQSTLNQMTNNGQPVEVQIIHKDSQSNPNRASEVAVDLIQNHKVDLMIVKDTPDTVNPVADQCELNGIPCLSTSAPWQAYFFGRKGDPAKGFEWTYHFFWGVEDIANNFIDIWDQSGVAKRVGALFPNDSDGLALGDAEHGFPVFLKKAGYELTDPGRYEPLNNDFTAQITAFKEARCEIVTGVMIPPDFATFWSQAAQQGFKPKVVTIGKALLFPSVVNSLGDRGEGLTAEVWWSPEYPFASSLTGQSARELAAAYTASSGKPWTATLGFNHAIFEIALDVVKRTKVLRDPKSVLAALASTDLKTIAGPINWKNGPVKNVTKTPVAGGQWRKTGDHMDLVVTTNRQHPEIPVGGELKLLN